MPNDKDYEYKEVSYSSEQEFEQDLLSREALGWDIVSQNLAGGGVSGGCGGCFMGIPIFIPFPGGRKRIVVVYRKKIA
jgi:hypothetical protein